MAEIIKKDAMHTLLGPTAPPDDGEMHSHRLASRDAKPFSEQLGDWASDLTNMLSESGWPPASKRVCMLPTGEWLYPIPPSEVLRDMESLKKLKANKPHKKLQANKPYKKLQDYNCSIQLGADFILKNCEQLSEEYFAARIVQLADSFEATNDVQSKHFYALEIGRMVEIGKLRRLFLKDVEARKRQDQGLVKGRDVVRANNAQKRIEAEKWRSKAREIANESNREGRALTEHVRKELLEQGIAKSRRSIRDALSKK